MQTYRRNGTACILLFLAHLYRTIPSAYTHSRRLEPNSPPYLPHTASANTSLHCPPFATHAPRVLQAPFPCTHPSRVCCPPASKDTPRVSLPTVPAAPPGRGYSVGRRWADRMDVCVLAAQQPALDLTCAPRAFHAQRRRSVRTVQTIRSAAEST